MKIQQLRFLAEVARRDLSVSAAAEALHTSQPGVSRQIKDLEQELGVEIFVRHGKRLTALTEPGRAVLHLEFTPRGEQAWLSVRDADRVDVYDTRRLERVTSLPAEKPSGIFFTARAGRVGY